MQEVQPRNSTGVWRLGTRVEAKAATPNAVPWREVAPHSEQVELWLLNIASINICRVIAHKGDRTEKLVRALASMKWVRRGSFNDCWLGTTGCSLSFKLVYGDVLQRLGYQDLVQPELGFWALRAAG